LRLLLGPLLVIAGIAAYIVPLRMGLLPRALFVFPWPTYLGIAAGVALALALAVRRRRRVGPWAAAGVALLLGALFVVGLPRGTHLPPAAGSFAPGTALPDFTLPSSDGGEVTLSALRGQRVVLVFHRGHW
jgi:hypothetical protein